MTGAGLAGWMVAKAVSNGSHRAAALLLLGFAVGRAWNEGRRERAAQIALMAGRLASRGEGDTPLSMSPPRFR